jgi:hypothetical protein
MVNFGGPNPSVPATRWAIIWFPRRVRNPWTVLMVPMTGEKEGNGALGLANQYESLEFST